MEVLNALLEAGADPNVRLKTHLWFLEWENKFGHDITGATPFWRAAFAQDLDAMKALAAHGAGFTKTEEAVVDLAGAGLTVRRLLDVIPESDAQILEAIRSLAERGLVEILPGDE